MDSMLPVPYTAATAAASRFVKNLFANVSSTITFPPAPAQQIETSTDRRARALKHLIKGNHANHAILYHNLEYDNHMDHILGAAYLLGATQEQLNDIYAEQSKELESWQDAPAEITQNDWIDFLGKREYQRAFIDFFEDQLVRFSYDWRALVHEFLFEGERPLINNVICALAHPVIHLSYGYELGSKDMSIEALALIGSTYNYLHKYSEDPVYSTRKGAYSSQSPLEILNKVAEDARFDKIVPTESTTSIDDVFAKAEDLILEYCNALEITDGSDTFQRSQRTSIALVAAGPASHNFYLVHVLTSSHAVRVLLPLTPARHQIPLIRQWWLFALAAYIVQGRPRIDLAAIADYELDGKSWKDATYAALSGQHKDDSHFVKAVRAMKAAEETWGDADQSILKAAVKFTQEFNGWKYNPQ